MRFLAILSALLWCSFSFSQDHSIESIPKELLDNADAVIRLDHLAIQVHSINQMSYQVRQIVTVLNKSGDGHAAARVFYDDDKKIKKIEATIYDAFGNEVEQVKRRDFKDVAAADGFSLYLDDRLLYHDYVPVQYPYTVEFTYEIETSDTGMIPQWYFVSGYGVSVENSSYTITYPSNDLKPIIKEENLQEIDFKKEESPTMLSYTSSGIQAFVEEGLSPPFQTFSPRLSVRLPKFHYKGIDAEVTDWKGLGGWIQDELLSGRDELEESTISKAKELVKGIDDDLEKAKIIYKYVQDNTRYISVQIGIGGLQPISAIEVDKVKYGDCKGLTNYTKALLRAVGVESYYTVVESGRTKVDFEEDFPDLLQGNHVILAIPYKGKYYWVDCTSQIHPFGFIGDFTDDRMVLVVTPDGGELVRTDSYLDIDNAQYIKANYKILDNLSIDAQVAIETKGTQYDNRFVLERSSKDDIKKYYKDFWDNINGLEVSDYSFDNDKEKVSFTETVNLSARNYVSKNGNDYLLILNAFNNNTYVPPRYRDRKLPFMVQRGFYDQDETTIEIPESFHFTDLPDKVSMKTEFGSYVAEVEKRNDRKLVYKRKLLLKAGEYPKESYDEFRSFLRSVAKMDNQKILLKNEPQD